MVVTKGKSLGFPFVVKTPKRIRLQVSDKFQLGLELLVQGIHRPRNVLVGKPLEELVGGAGGKSHHRALCNGADLGLQIAQLHYNRLSLSARPQGSSSSQGCSSPHAWMQPPRQLPQHQAGRGRRRWLPPTARLR